MGLRHIYGFRTKIMHYTKPQVNHAWPDYLMRRRPFWSTWYFHYKHLYSASSSGLLRGAPNCQLVRHITLLQIFLVFWVLLAYTALNYCFLRSYQIFTMAKQFMEIKSIWTCTEWKIIGAIHLYSASLSMLVDRKAPLQQICCVTAPVIN